MSAARSLWAAGTPLPSYPPLQADTSADVCVIGAGIAGLSVAYQLARARKSVVVIDDGPVAGGATSRSTAHLSTAVDDRYFRLERWHGALGAKLAAASRRLAIDTIEATIERERVDCGFERVDGFLAPAGGGGEDQLARELEAARRAGLEVERVDAAPLGGPALRFGGQAQIDPLRYAAALAAAIRERGGRIHCHTHADRIAGDVPARVTCGAFQVSCLAIVVATNTPIGAEVDDRPPPHATCALAARCGAAQPPHALWWDTAERGRHVRRASGRGADGTIAEFVVVGGTDPHASLEAWARERIAGLGAVEYAWGGARARSPDGLAHIGRSPVDAENVFVAIVDSSRDLTDGTIAGLVLGDLVLGRRNRFAPLYEPSRRTLRAATPETAAPYADGLGPGDVESVAQIGPDSGAVLRRGTTKVAVYRGPRGALHERSATCPHLGCVVAWNASDRTWDCPCHGSRFDRFGKVIHGPANRSLGPARKT